MTPGDRAAEAESRFLTIADIAPVMIWMAGPDRRGEWFNAGWLAFTGRAMAAERGQGWIEGVHPDDRAGFLRTLDDAFDARRPFGTEHRLRRHDGAWRWVLNKGVPHFGADGGFAGFAGTCADIHEHRAREDVLQRLLDDKETLLKEIHHRVKNNFQLVISLISLEARKAVSAAERDHLRSLMGRIGVMATIQEELLSQPHAGSIEFGDYLKRLLASLRDLHPGGELKTTIRVEPVSIPADKAVPLGLIANEVITNMLKHAFVDRGPGEISVSLSREATGHVVLCLRDDGVGIDSQDKPLGAAGLQLIHALSAQAGASVTIESPPGTVVTVRLPGHALQ